MPRKITEEEIQPILTKFLEEAIPVAQNFGKIPCEIVSKSSDDYVEFYLIFNNKKGKPAVTFDFSNGITLEVYLPIKRDDGKIDFHCNRSLRKLADLLSKWYLIIKSGSYTLR